MVIGASSQVVCQVGEGIELCTGNRGRYRPYHRVKLASPLGTGLIEIFTSHHRSTQKTFGGIVVQGQLGYPGNGSSLPNDARRS